MKRFWNKVDKTPGLGPKGDCWEWKAGKVQHRGYGLFCYKRKRVKAHRVAWLLEHGNWPELNICHHCDNPACVRPSHLFEGTQQDNMKDMKEKERQAKPKGETNNQAILTENLVINDVIPSLKRGESGASIGRRLGVHKSTISDIKRGKRWSHL
jgi:HNH endonuclease/CENP-B N-terminal DNA-binding domain